MLTFGTVIVVGWMLAIPLFPEDVGRSQAQRLAGLDFYPTINVLAGFLKHKLK